MDARTESDLDELVGLVVGSRDLLLAGSTGLQRALARTLPAPVVSAERAGKPVTVQCRAARSSRSVARWSSRWPDTVRMQNRDANGVAHFPGWTLGALRLIFEERGAMACGHETLDTDGGIAVSRGDGSLERYVLDQDRWQIEMLANLDALPEAGALIVATWPKPKRGSGFPARVFAIVPHQ
ncbi:hypothetical protein FAZ69_13405 [Trinickia terrae]|uniref:Cyclase family protein n=1 Tax=Trinickia terrae TaxID=2571161 RepID=A0A4U1I5V7_9BURK|nr:hypothetical protein [Trinickia terrae]TKC88743.1 hypothetical protein FAZ69_13405 [Trinickia terrae]